MTTINIKFQLFKMKKNGNKNNKTKRKMMPKTDRQTDSNHIIS